MDMTVSAVCGFKSAWYHTLLGRGSLAHQRTAHTAHSGGHLRKRPEHFVHSRQQRHPAAPVPRNGRVVMGEWPGVIKAVTAVEEERLKGR
jgi:hypothetical protein